MLSYGLIYISALMMIFCAKTQKMPPFDEEIDYEPEVNRKLIKNGEIQDSVQRDLAKIGSLFINYLFQDDHTMNKRGEIDYADDNDTSNSDQVFSEEIERFLNVSEEVKQDYDEIECKHPKLNYNPASDEQLALSKGIGNEVKALYDELENKGKKEKTTTLTPVNETKRPQGKNRCGRSDDLKIHFYKSNPEKNYEKKSISANLYSQNQNFNIPQKYDYIAFLSDNDKFLDVPAVKFNVIYDRLERSISSQHYSPFYTWKYNTESSNHILNNFDRPVLLVNTLFDNPRLSKRSSENQYLQDANLLIDRVKFFLKLGDDYQIPYHGSVLHKPSSKKSSSKKEKVKRKKIRKKKEKSSHIKISRPKKESEIEEYELEASTSSQRYFRRNDENLVPNFNKDSIFSKSYFGINNENFVPNFHEDLRSRNEKLLDDFSQSFTEDFLPRSEENLFHFSEKTSEDTTIKYSSTTEEKYALDMSPIEIDNYVKDVMYKIDLPQKKNEEFVESHIKENFGQKGFLKEENLVNENFQRDSLVENKFDSFDNNLSNLLSANYNNEKDEEQNTEENKIISESSSSEKNSNISCAYLLDLFKNIDELKRNDPNLMKICPKLSELSHIGANLTTQESLKISSSTLSVNTAATMTESSETTETTTLSSSPNTETTTESTLVSSGTAELPTASVTTEETTSETVSISLSRYTGLLTHDLPPKTSPYPTKILERTVKKENLSAAIEQNELLTSFKFPNNTVSELELSKENETSETSTNKNLDSTKTSPLPVKIEEADLSRENFSAPIEQSDLAESFQILNRTFQKLEESLENFTSKLENKSTVEKISSSTISETEIMLETSSEVTETASTLTTETETTSNTVISESKTSATTLETNSATVTSETTEISTTTPEIASTFEISESETSKTQESISTAVTSETTLPISETEISTTTVETTSATVTLETIEISTISSETATTFEISESEARTQETISTTVSPDTTLRISKTEISTTNLESTSATETSETTISETEISTTPPETTFIILYSQRDSTATETSTTPETISATVVPQTTPKTGITLATETTSATVIPETSLTISETEISTTPLETSPATVSFKTTLTISETEISTTPETISSAVTSQTTPETEFTLAPTIFTFLTTTREASPPVLLTTEETSTTNLSIQTSNFEVEKTPNKVNVEPLSESITLQTTSFINPVTTESQVSQSKGGTTKEQYLEDNLLHFTHSLPKSILKMEGSITNRNLEPIAEISVTPVEDVKLTSLTKILFPPYVHISTVKTNEFEENVPKVNPPVLPPLGHKPTNKPNDFEENISTVNLPLKYTAQDYDHSVLPPLGSMPTYKTNNFKENLPTPIYKTEFEQHIPKEEPPDETKKKVGKFTPLPFTFKPPPDLSITSVKLEEETSLLFTSEATPKEELLGKTKEKFGEFSPPPLTFKPPSEFSATPVKLEEETSLLFTSEATPKEELLDKTKEKVGEFTPPPFTFKPPSEFSTTPVKLEEETISLVFTSEATPGEIKESTEENNYKDEDLSAILDLLGNDLATSTDSPRNTTEGILKKVKNEFVNKLETLQKDLKLVLAVQNLLLKSKNRQNKQGKRRKKEAPPPKNLITKEDRLKEVPGLGKILELRSKSLKKIRRKRRRRKKRET